MMLASPAAIRFVLTLLGGLVASVAAADDGDARADFSGGRAMGHLEEICRLGPRPSGSPAMDRQRALLADHFRKAGGIVAGQAFQIRDRHSGKPVHLENLIVTWHPDRTDRVLIGAHYDTRPFADRDPADPRGTFIGANDGASGVALMMELAGAMPGLPGDVGVDFVLFDAEEYVVAPRDPYCLGSNFFARTHAADRKAGRLKHDYRCGVVVDMVADRDLEIWQEQHGVDWPDTRPVVEAIWDVAGRMGVRQFVARPKYAVEDDHVPLRMIAGIPTCDIIDFDFPQWHTTEDTPENCSAESLHAVGSVLLQWLREQR
jgi:hypothetical protein